METFFGCVMYIVFGKRWIMWQMRQGYKSAIFVNECEIDMTKSRMRDIQKEIDKMVVEIDGHKKIPPHTKYDYLGDEVPSAKQEYEAQKKADDQNKVVITTLENRIKARTSDLQEQDGDLQKSFSIAYTNRIKYDFVKNYKIRKTYADKGYEQSFSKK